MPDGSRTYKGKVYKDPGGSVIIPRRAFVEDPLLAVKPWHPWMFWQYLVYLAVWDKRGRVISRHGEVVHLERGQLYYALRYFEQPTGWKKDKVLEWLVKFEKGLVPSWASGARIRRDTRHQGTVLTIINYDPYQDPAFYRQTTPQTPSRQTADTEQTNNNQEESRGLTECARASTAPSRHQAPSWRDLRASREYGVWNSSPEHVRGQMLLDALETELPPENLVQWVLEQLEVLELAIPTETYQELEAIAELDRDVPPETPDLEAQLRQKLAALRTGGDP